jgi:hypothetical protein
MVDVNKMAADLFERFTAHVDKSLAPLRAAVAELGNTVAAEVKRQVEQLPPAPAGQPGKDADPAVIERMVAAAVATLPPAAPGPAPTAEQISEAVAKYLAANPPPAGQPGAKGADGAGLASGLIDRHGNLILTLTNGETKDLGLVIGKDGQHADPAKPEAVAALIREQVAKAIEPLKVAGPGVDQEALRDMVDWAATVAVAKIPPAPAGQPGKDADPEVVAALVSAEVEKAVAALPPARDGRDVDPKAVAELVAVEVEKAAAGIPRPADGKSVSVDDVTPLIADLVAKAVAVIPVPKDGKDADQAAIDRKIAEGIEKAVAAIPRPADGKDADQAMIDQKIAAGIERAVAALPKPVAGRDGLDAVEFLRNEKGHLVCTMSDGSVKDLGVINGADGFGFDDLQAEYDGDRRLVVRFVQGERVKEFEAVLPVIIDRGVYSPGKSYDRGDAISFGGALWVCQAEKSAEKPGTNADWRLAVKKGRDGRDGGNRPGNRP